MTQATTPLPQPTAEDYADVLSDAEITSFVAAYLTRKILIFPNQQRYIATMIKEAKHNFGEAFAMKIATLLSGAEPKLRFRLGLILRQCGISESPLPEADETGEPPVAESAVTE